MESGRRRRRQQIADIGQIKIAPIRGISDVLFLKFRGLDIKRLHRDTGRLDHTRFPATLKYRLKKLELQ